VKKEKPLGRTQRGREKGGAFPKPSTHSRGGVVNGGGRRKSALNSGGKLSGGLCSEVTAAGGTIYRKRSLPWFGGKKFREGQPAPKEEGGGMPIRKKEIVFGKKKLGAKERRGLFGVRGFLDAAEGGS